MNSYVFGASGFIGSHLVKQLNEVVTIPHEKILKFKSHPFDYLYFLSTYGNLASQTDEDQMFKANLEDLVHVLKEIKNLNFKSFVFMSSSSVMLKNQTTYSRFKKAAEEILLAVMERHNKPICIIRPFSVTGVGEQKEHLIPTLIDAAFTGKLVNLVPHPTHDFIDVEDVISGILTLSKNQARGIFQLGTGIKTSNIEVLNLVQQITKKNIKVNLIQNLRPYDNDNWVSTNFKARGFGWLPKKSLEDSITEMVKEYVQTK